MMAFKQQWKVGLLVASGALVACAHTGTPRESNQTSAGDRSAGAASPGNPSGNYGRGGSGDSSGMGSARPDSAGGTSSGSTADPGALNPDINPNGAPSTTTVPNGNNIPSPSQQQDAMHPMTP